MTAVLDAVFINCNSSQNPCCCFVVSVLRLKVKEAEDGLSDDQQDASDEDMEWSGNSSLFADLSISQLDGAADESSGKFLTNS